MDSLEVNIKLKEDIRLLENMYCDLMKEFRSLMSVPSSALFVHEIINMMCSEQIKAQRNEESQMVKFDSIEDFARYLKAMTDISIKFLKEKYGVESL